RPYRRDDGPARPHQGAARHAVRPPARGRCHPRRSALCGAAPAHLAPAAFGAAAPHERTEGGRVTTIDQTRPLPDTEPALSDDRARAERAAGERRTRRAILNLAIRVISVAIFLGLWELAGRGIDPVLFTTPSAVSVAAVDMIRSGELWTYLYPSLVVLLYGFSLAVVFGIGIGLLLARY